MVAREADIPDGERKIVTVDAYRLACSITTGNGIALRNSCLHRGGPVCTGSLVDDTLTCPWHGFQYNVTNGQLLVDPAAFLDTYPVLIEDRSGCAAGAGCWRQRLPRPTAAASTRGDSPCKPNEFRLSDVPPGTMKCVETRRSNDRRLQR